jgi:hypothetical protein
VRLAGLEGNAQRLARADEMFLAYNVIKGLRTKPLGERRGRLCLPK